MIFMAMSLSYINYVQYPSYIFILLLDGIKSSFKYLFLLLYIKQLLDGIGLKLLILYARCVSTRELFQKEYALNPEPFGFKQRLIVPDIILTP